MPWPIHPLKGKDGKARCGWCGDDPLYMAYHDEEWGVPVRDDQKLFEFLTLEGAQAGLSWATILKKREGYRRAFAGFDAKKVARYGAAKIRELLNNPGIVRNRLKVESTVSNAKAFLAVQKEFGSFSRYAWAFTQGRILVNKIKRMDQIRATSPESDAWSKDMKKRGFRFVGSTILYAHMQATGMVNDHLVGCFRYRQLASVKTRS
jgi:DNA-3-methyladenine glycosylase I